MTAAPYTRTQRVVLQLVVVALFAGSLLTAILTTRNLVFALASRNWPVVPGRITQSGMRETSSSSGRGSLRTVFIPLIQYEYQVGRESFTSTKISFAGQTYSHRSEVESLNRRYPYGQPVQVYHSPRSPDFAVLEPGAGFHTWLGPLITVPFAAALSLLLAVWIIRHRRVCP